MAETYTTGEWVAKTGQEDAFVDAWTAFATWAHGMPGAGSLQLAQDLSDNSRFVSFGRWDGAESAHRWKSDAEFGKRMAQVQQHVAQFHPAELRLVRVVGDDQP